MTTPACPLCNSDRTVRHLPRHYHEVWRCLQCDLHFVHPQPTQQDLEELYGKAYFHRDPDYEVGGYFDYEGDRANIERTFRARLRYIEKVRPEKGRILDVGCAMGFFVDVAEDAGWSAYGLDISEHAVERARLRHGDRVERGTFPEANPPADEFDAITMWDYLEHTQNPRQELSRAFDLLSEGGLLALTTPDVRTWPAKIMGHRWMHLKPQEHLFYFSRRTLRRLLEEVGFRVLNIRSEGKFVSLELLLRRLRPYLPPMAPLVAQLLKIKRLTKVSLYIDSLDNILVLAEKPRSQ